jgi:hypothetical protein
MREPALPIREWRIYRSGAGRQSLILYAARPRLLGRTSKKDRPLIPGNSSSGGAANIRATLSCERARDGQDQRSDQGEGAFRNSATHDEAQDAGRGDSDSQSGRSGHRRLLNLI